MPIEITLAYIDREIALWNAEAMAIECTGGIATRERLNWAIYHLARRTYLYDQLTADDAPQA